MKIPIVSELISEGKNIDILFWVGCAGNFDARAQKVTRPFCNILNEINCLFNVL